MNYILNKYLAYYIILPIGFLLYSCNTSKKLNSNNYFKLAPPNCILVTDSLYFDKTEIDNIDWREYLFWTMRIFGSNSNEYLEAIPDTSVWLKEDSCLHVLKDKYFRNEFFDYDPVVGITQQQVKGFSKWRSDRVLELFLIENKKLKINPNQNREDHFTIEKYYTNEYNHKTSDEKWMFYPEYRLPTLQERKILLNYIDKIKSNNLESIFNTPHFIYTNSNPCIKDSIVLPIYHKDSNDFSNKNIIIINARGNVAEWTNENNHTAGGSWKDNIKGIFTNDIKIVSEANAFTGFRNVCELKEWK